MSDGEAAAEDDNNGTATPNGDNISDASTKPLITNDQVEELFKGLQQFSFMLYHACRGETLMPNFVISPLSVSAILAMTWAGSTDDTSEQLRSLLHLDHFDEQVYVHMGFEELLKRLDPTMLPKSILHFANRIYVNDDFRVHSDFLALLQRHYGVSVASVGFTRDVDRLRLLINHWVEEETYGHIKELIASGSLDHLAKAILISCIHFKGAWQRKFYHDPSHPGRFYTDKDKTTPMDVIQQQGRYPYHLSKSLRCSAVQLPYAGDNLVCIVLVPRDVTGLSALEAKLTDEELVALVGDMKPTTVNVMLPRFHVETSLILSDTFAGLGAGNMFSRKKADLNGMATPVEGKDERLYLSALYHRAQIEIGEEGGSTVAEVPVETGTSCFCKMNVVQFTADRPFAFIIREVQSGMIIYIGRIREPTPPRR